jgi:hypothetical protein
VGCSSKHSSGNSNPGLDRFGGGDYLLSSIARYNFGVHLSNARVGSIMAYKINPTTNALLRQFYIPNVQCCPAVSFLAIESPK